MAWSCRRGSQQVKSRRPAADSPCSAAHLGGCYLLPGAPRMAPGRCPAAAAAAGGAGERRPGERGPAARARFKRRRRRRRRRGAAQPPAPRLERPHPGGERGGRDQRGGAGPARAGRRAGRTWGRARRGGQGGAGRTCGDVKGAGRNGGTRWSGWKRSQWIGRSSRGHPRAPGCLQTVLECLECPR